MWKKVSTPFSNIYTYMCLFPRFIKNKKYQMYNLKKGDTPCDDWRKLYVPVGCGNCYECRKQKAQQWRVRLIEELKVQKFPYYVTFTFSNEALKQIATTYDNYRVNAIAGKALRLFLERYRKKYKVSIKHWFITELGQENTERIHLHGILFPQQPITETELKELWKYGRIDIGDYCNERSINYIIKYVTKIDAKHKDYKPDIFCSAGIGANYMNTDEAKRKYKFKNENTIEYYTLKNGAKVALPIYYRNKAWTQNERDKLWTYRLNKGKIYVNGIEVKNVETEKGQKYYRKLLQFQQKWNNNIGYGNNSIEWEEKHYLLNFKMLQKAKK